MTNIQEKKLKNANSTSKLLTGPKQGHVHKLGHWHILEDRRERHFCVTSVNSKYKKCHMAEIYGQHRVVCMNVEEGLSAA
jgi:hypothetical protein